MPSKKKKYNARFPAGRIKKIMQTDDEVGKVAQAVPVIISRTLELFVESLLTKAQEITSAKNAKTLSPSHMKQCILSESRFDFLKELVASLPDVTTSDGEEGNFPPALAPPAGNTHSSDLPRSYSRKTEKSSCISTSTKDAVQGSPKVSTATTSSNFAADFYRDTLKSTNSAGSANHGSMSAQDTVPNEDLDEDYDTT